MNRPPPTNLPRLVSQAQAGLWLGVNKHTMRKIIKECAIPIVWGKIDLQDIEKALQKQKEQAT